MKFALAVALSMFAIQAFANVALVDKMIGSYKAVDSACPYDSANIKITRMNGSQILLVTLQNSSTKAFNSQAIDLDNMWAKVRTTRGFQRIIKQDRIQGQTILAEEKNCSLGWVSCDEWVTKAEVTLLNSDTIDARLSDEEPSCVFKKLSK